MRPMKILYKLENPHHLMHDSVIITNIYNKLSLVRDATTLPPNECMQHLGFARDELQAGMV
jgi:hypothetical protein